jgi:hypothetical protein
MATMFPGRYTAAIEDGFVVFLIGMRLNRPWKVHRWWPVFMAMGRMLSRLARDPSRGLLGYRILPGLRTVSVLQYWRSFADLERFAHSREEPHLAAWRQFNRTLGNSGDVGIWHETFQVAPGAYECVYVNMPRYGLAAATAHVPVARRGESAARRMRATSQVRCSPPLPRDEDASGGEPDRTLI